MNADEMMYELGFEKVDKCSNEDSVMYYYLTENDHWIVRFFKSYGIVNYLVSHTHWFETDREWNKNGCNSRFGPAQSNTSSFAGTWLAVEKEKGKWIILNLMELRLKWYQL